MSWLAYLFCGIFIATGASTMIAGVNEIQLARSSSSWSSIKGEIVYSKIITSSDDDGDTYRPEVKFIYKIGGQSFTGNKVFFGYGTISSSNRQYSQRITDKYPQGKTIEVFYDSTNPAQSVIERGITKKSFIQLTFGSMFFCMGSLFGLLSWLME